MKNAEILSKTYGIEGKVNFHTGNGGLIYISVNTNKATSEICLYGAQMISYKPAGQEDVLWMSERSLFEEGKAIRGGIPLCFPWFGPHAFDKTKPQHGFARLQYWDVKSITETAGDIIVELNLHHSDHNLQLWPHLFSATAKFIIGSSLHASLTVTNTGEEAFTYSDALHTYFNISNIDTVSIEGLQDATYYDGFGMDLKTQQNPLLHFNDETNRRYVNTVAGCIIHDKEKRRSIQVDKEGSKVTVVWNPAEETTRSIADMLPDGYKNFVCVEPANAYEVIDLITLEPGESHTLGTAIKIVE